jgi:pyruvate dehydrogenase E1 component
MAAHAATQKLKFCSMTPLQNPTSLCADSSQAETHEWRDALLSLAANEGPARVRQILDELARLAREQRIGWQPELNTPYINTIAVED